MKKNVRIMVIAVHKGGTSKSTSSFLLGHLAATDSHEKVRAYAHRRKGERTLLVDLDFQSNLSRAVLKEEYNSIKGGVIDAIAKEDARPYIVQSSEHENLYILPATSQLASFDDVFAKSLASLENPYHLLESALEDAVDQLDIQNIIIDTSPSLNKMVLLGLNVSFGCATNVLVPFQLDSFGAHSISDITKTLQSVRSTTNPNLKLVGLVPVLLDGTSKRDKEILAEVKEIYGDLVLDSKIMRKTDIKSIVENGFSERYATERKAMKMYYELFQNLKERV